MSKSSNRTDRPVPVSAVLASSQAAKQLAQKSASDNSNLYKRAVTGGFTGAIILITGAIIWFVFIR